MGVVICLQRLTSVLSCLTGIAHRDIESRGQPLVVFKRALELYSFSDGT